MELTIHREVGFWTAHIEPLRLEANAEEKVYPLVPDTGSLLLLAQAMHNVYPKVKVFIDPSITDNPLLAHRLTMDKRFRLEPDYIRVQYSLNNSGNKLCEFCGRVGWYNAYGNDSPFVGWWECINFHCGARMHNDGTWFKLNRFARK